MIIRTPHAEEYVVIDNRALEDERLSWKARGILAFLLAKPDGWRVMVSHLVNSGPDGKAAVTAALTELEECGYVVRPDQAKDDGGKFTHRDIEIHEQPVGGFPGTKRAKPQVAPSPKIAHGGSHKTPGETGSDFPATEKPATDKPSAENRPRVSNQLPSTQVVLSRASLAKPTDDRVVAKAHELTTLAFEQAIKPVLRSDGNPFAATLKLIECELRSGRPVNDVKRAIEAGVDVWTKSGLRTAIARQRAPTESISARSREHAIAAGRSLGR